MFKWCLLWFIMNTFFSQIILFQTNRSVFLLFTYTSKQNFETTNFFHWWIFIRTLKDVWGRFDWSSYASSSDELVFLLIFYSILLEMFLIISSLINFPEISKSLSAAIIFRRFWIFAAEFFFWICEILALWCHYNFLHHAFLADM